LKNVTYPFLSGKWRSHEIRNHRSRIRRKC